MAVVPAKCVDDVCAGGEWDHSPQDDSGRNECAEGEAPDEEEAAALAVVGLSTANHRDS